MINIDFIVWEAIDDSGAVVGSGRGSPIEAPPESRVLIYVERPWDKARRDLVVEMVMPATLDA